MLFLKVSVSKALNPPSSDGIAPSHALEALEQKIRLAITTYEQIIEEIRSSVLRVDTKRRIQKSFTVLDEQLLIGYLPGGILNKAEIEMLLTQNTPPCTSCKKSNVSKGI